MTRDGIEVCIDMINKRLKEIQKISTSPDINKKAQHIEKLVQWLDQETQKGLKALKK